MAEEKFIIDGDAEGYVSEIERSIKAQLQLAQSQEKLVSTVTSLNNVTGEYTTKVKTLNKEGNLVTRTFKSVGKDIDWVGETISNAAQQQSRYISQVKSLTDKNNNLKKSLTELRDDYSDLHKTARQYYQLAQKKVSKEDFAKLEGQIKKYERSLASANRTIATMQKRMESMHRTVNRYKKNMEDASKSSKGFVLSTQAVIRLISVSVTLSLFNDIKNALVEGIKLSVEFHKRLAEINTIARTSSPELEKLGRQIKDVSGEFGLDRMDVAEATYQALSKQIITTANAQKFLSDASRFALAGVTDLTTAVGAAASVMNVYNIDVTRAEEVFSKLLKTVELGSLRAADFNRNFGRTLALGKSVGLAFEEVAAQLTVVTNRGLDAAAAQSQIQALYLKLIKPTEALREVYRSLGATTIEQIVTTQGWAGAIELLSNASGGLSDELGKLLSRQRAIISATIQSGTAVELYGENLEKIRGAQAGYNQITDDFIQSTGPQATITWTKLGNSLKESSDIMLEALVDAGRAISDSGFLPEDRIERLAELKREMIKLGLATEGTVITLKQMTTGYDDLINRVEIAKDEFGGNADALNQITKNVAANIDATSKEIVKSVLEQNKIIFESIDRTTAAYAKSFAAISKTSKDALNDLKADAKSEQSLLDARTKQIQQLTETIQASTRQKGIEDLFAGVDTGATDINKVATDIYTLEQRLEKMQDTAGDATSIEQLENSLYGLDRVVNTLNDSYDKLGLSTGVDADQIRLEAQETLLEKLKAENDLALETKASNDGIRASLTEQLSLLDQFNAKQLKKLENEKQLNEFIEGYKSTMDSILTLQGQIGEEYYTREQAATNLAILEENAASRIAAIRNEDLNRELKGIQQKIDQENEALKVRNKQAETANELITSQETYIQKLREELAVLKLIQAQRQAFQRESAVRAPGGGTTTTTTTIDQSQASTSSFNTFNFNTAVSRSDAVNIAQESSRLERRLA